MQAYILGCNELHLFPRIESARVVLGVVFRADHENHNEKIL